MPDFEQSNGQQLKNDLKANLKQEEQLFLTNQFNKQKDQKQINYSINEFGQFCFEPTQIVILSGFTLFVQGLFFSIIILIFNRTKFEKPSKYEIAF